MTDEENSKSPVADSSPATSQTNQNEENKESPTSGLAVIKIIIIILLVIAILLYSRNKMVTQNKNIPYDPAVNAPSIPINNTYDNQELSEAEKAKQREKKAAIDKLYAMGVEYTDELAILSAYNNPKKLDLLLKAGADVNFRLQEIDHGATTLYKAVAIGNVECVKLLLNAPGIKVNLSDMNGKTPLLCAADKGHTECVKLLLGDSRIDVNRADSDGKTPLLCAADKGHTECVKLLLGDSRIDVNRADADGKTPLLCAADKGHTECVKLLLAERLIDVYKADNDGKTPLQRAESNGHTEIVKLLKGPANHNKRPMRHPRRYRGI